MISAFSMTMVMPGAKSARSDGLGRIFLGSVTSRHAATAFVLTAIFSAIIYGFGYVICPYSMRNFVVCASGAAALGLFTGYGLRALFTARFGGLTGDNLGCIHEMSEVMTLLITAFFLKL